MKAQTPGRTARYLRRAAIVVLVAGVAAAASAQPMVPNLFAPSRGAHTASGPAPQPSAGAAATGSGTAAPATAAKAGATSATGAAAAGSGSAGTGSAGLPGAQSIVRLFSDNDWLAWLFLLVFVLAGVALGRTAAFLLRKTASRVSSSGKTLRGAFLESAAGPSNLALMTIGIALGLARIVMDPPVRSFVGDLISLLSYITIFWYLHNAVGDLEIVLRRVAARTETKLDDMLVPLIRKTLRLFVVIVGVLLVAENVFRQNIATWLAGLGIAGIAVSLAAQDSLKNLFGSITILFDRPFKLGERIIFSGFDGPVEEIGFRSIKIRTLTGHLVTVPNSKVVSDAVENIGARPYIRRLMNVTITYDTPREKVAGAVEIIRRLFEEEGLREPIHGRVGSDEFPPKAYFSDYNADSLNIMVIYWFMPPNYWDYMEHTERFNLRLFEEFEKAGIEFAFPTQTLFLAGDPKRPLSPGNLGPHEDSSTT